MLRKIPGLRAATALAMFGALAAQSASAASGQAPVVVELFTSQGCSSCPPADEFLGELAMRDDVLALAYHVDYWDYIGWKDPFASADFTQRQRDYQGSLGTHMVYTPQMVIDGKFDAVGSRRSEVGRIILESAAHAKIPIAIDAAPSGELIAHIPAATIDLSDPAVVWMVRFDAKHVTEVGRGENSGATLTDYNVVRELRQMGEWTGAALDVPLGVRKEDLSSSGCAVIVQGHGLGPVIGAAVIRPDPGSGS